MKENKEKKVTMSIRLTESEFAKIRRTCYRDEIKPAVFAYERMMTGIEELIKKQEIEGYQCMNPL